MIRAASVFLFVSAFAVAPILLVSSCSVKKTGAARDVTNSKLPAEVSPAPSTFRCEARVMKVHSFRIGLVISKMIQQGAGLFYPVAAGDTINAIRTTTQEDYLVKDSVLEIIIEERIKMNSDVPDFIIRQAKPLRK